ncbi:methylenetetrahydrofolate reductase [Sediminivirga luteola]|uniref:methylenetetrahydrofolate reductase n=1 Tax=Sediminivirga luteola TaxID=1774748 RepID=UPI001F55DDBD|nr:methylenetetrahydrofolate reductase [Sediminivirga luteola]MCI2265432.1 methylenetetrahydrofolate reductase [Sediminivirga luteola]
MPPPLSASAPSDADDAPASVRRPPRRLTLSYELFPPRSDVQARTLPDTIERLAATGPDFVSVTYGAAGPRRATTTELLRFLVDQTPLRPLAHLTCVGNTEEQLREIIDEFLSAGVRGILAIRGDIPDGLGWPPPGALRYGHHLVRLIREVEAERAIELAAGRVSIGVAAYPNGHPDSPGPRHDIDVLLAKQRAGADLAISQQFYAPGEYLALLRRAELAGVRLPILPGIMPLTEPGRILKLSRLAQIEPPAALLHELELARDETERHRLGVAATVRLIRAVLHEGAPGLHLYTFNNHRAALDVLDELGWPSAA